MYLERGGLRVEWGRAIRSKLALTFVSTVRWFVCSMVRWVDGFDVPGID